MEEEPAIEWHEEDYANNAIPAENRRNFISKVLGIVSAQLLFTTGITAAVIAWDDSNDWFKDNWWIVFIFLAMIIVPELILICFMESIARKVPINYILLFIFTLGFAGAVAMICSSFQPLSVLIVAIITTAITVLLSMYALYTTADFTKAIWVVVGFSCVLTIVGIVVMFFDLPRGVTVLIACLWVIIYGVFIVIDVQMLADGKKYKFSEDDYIVAALVLYSDVIMLFLELLQLLGKKK